MRRNAKDDWRKRRRDFGINEWLQPYSWTVIIDETSVTKVFSS